VNFANLVTLSRIFAIPLFILSLYLPFGNWFAAVVFCVIASTDFVDGFIARRYNLVSKSGAVLDPLADKLLVCAALIFLIGKGIDAWMSFIIISREFLVSGLRLLNPKIISARFLGKLKTLSQIVGIVSVLFGFSFSWYVMLFATIITVISGFDYFWHSRQILDL